MIRTKNNRNSWRAAADPVRVQAALFSVLALPLLLGGLSCLPVAAQGPSGKSGGREGHGGHERKRSRVPLWNQKEFKERIERLPARERQGVELLQRMVVASLAQPLIAREVTLNANGKETEQWVRWDPRQGLRRESIRPAGDIFLDDQKKAYFFQPRAKRWFERGETVLPRPQGRVGDVMRRLFKGELRATLDGQDTVAGRAADIVRVEPRDGKKGSSRRFWVDRGTGVRLKSEELAPNGRLLSSSYYLSVDLSPRFRDDDFAAPANAVPADRARKKKSFKSLADAHRAGFHPRLPGHVPKGFELQTVEVWDGKAGPGVTLRYRNGLTVLSLTQMPAGAMHRFAGQFGPGVGAGRFLPGPRGGDRAYLWREGETMYALLGSLSDAEMRRIAGSVK